MKRLREINANLAQGTAEDWYPRPYVIHQAWLVANELFETDTALPNVVPSDHAILFIWHRGGWDVEINIDEDEVYIYADQKMTGFLVKGWDGPLADSQVNQRIRNLLREISA